MSATSTGGLSVKETLAQVVERQPLTSEQMADLVGAMMDGQLSGPQIGAFLTAFRMKGETVEEVVGAALAMRSRMRQVHFHAPVLMDTCGTGGDGSGSVNVSTLAAFIVAACGLPVAKHGNRALSSRSGSHDVIEALGVDPAPSPDLAQRCLDEVGLAFLFAPTYHTATQAVAAARREVGFRTLFNLLGPLTNPAAARYHLNGVYASDKVIFLAKAHQQLGAKRALIVHGQGGLDEIATAGPTVVAELHENKVRTFELVPSHFGLEEEDPQGLKGGLPEHNAVLFEQTLNGAPGAYRNAALMSAAAALYIGGKAPTFRAAADLAASAIDSGAAARVLARLKVIAPAPPTPPSDALNGAR